MNTTEMLALLRFNALIEDTNADYTDPVCLRELNHSLTTKFERVVTDSGCGYWLQQKLYTTTQGIAPLRIPSRACAIAKVEIGVAVASVADSTFRRLHQAREGNADLYSQPASSQDTPGCWVARGDRIVLLPTPNAAYPVRVTYYLRPGRLIPTQTAGLITAINSVVPTFTVNSAPLSYDAAGSGTALSVGAALDIVSPSGWHEVQVASALITATPSGTQYSLAADTDISSVQVGDYIRAADQSEWPALPDDYHRCLVDVATIKVLIQRDMQQKASGFAQDVNADMKRFSDMIAVRAQEEPITVRAAVPSLRRHW